MASDKPMTPGTSVLDKIMAALAPHTYTLQPGHSYSESRVVTERGLLSILKTHLVGSIPETHVCVQWGSIEYKEILVTAPDGTQGIYWPDDAVYPLLKAMTADKEAQ